MNPGALTDQGIDLYSARSQALGLSRSAMEEVRAPALRRQYRGSVTELFVIDGFDQ